MPEFPKLFEAGRIGNLVLKNRIIFPPIITRFMNDDGTISQRIIEHYAERARGGAAMIVLEAAYPRSNGYPGRIFLNDDNLIPGLTKLVEAVHEFDSKIICEVNPSRGRADEHDPASPSNVPHPFTGIVPRSLTVSKIKQLEVEFGEGVRRAKDAGFDGVMVHGATGYLVSEFLSPLINQRTDQYGGNLQNRARFALELVAEAKKAAGDDYPLIFRIMADDKLEGGFNIEAAIVLCKILEEMGVDAIDVTAGAAETPEWTAPCMYMPPGCTTDLSEAIKKEITIPVCVAGRINDPYLAESILKESKADFVDIGRALLADPYFPEKALTGRAEDIRKCLACQRCIEAVIMEKVPLKCSGNPALGRESRFKKKSISDDKRKRVLVVGGGPGGMQAAIVSRNMGHDVTLWEKSGRLGGQLNIAGIPPFKEGLNSLLQYLKVAVDKSGVKVALNKLGTMESVSEFAPDTLIVAIGSIESMPEIPGVEGQNVITHRKVLSGEKDVGHRIVILGGGFIACETADFLAEKGKDLVLAFPEEAPMTIGLIDAGIRKKLLERLRKNQVNIIAGVRKFREITQEGICLVDKEGNEFFLEADNIVLATGTKADTAFPPSLKTKIPRIFEVGDCVEPRRLLEAIQEGASAALQL